MAHHVGPGPVWQKTCAARGARIADIVHRVPLRSGGEALIKPAGFPRVRRASEESRQA